MTNVLFETNIASVYYGGGIYNNQSSSPILTNVTFVANSAPNLSQGTGGAMANITACYPVLNNCIVSGNSAGRQGNQFYIAGGNISLNYSAYANGNNDVVTTEGTLTAANSIQLTPGSILFNNAASGDYTLASGSKAINGGNNAFYSDALHGSLDLGGNIRLMGSSIDMGAFENQTDFITGISTGSIDKLQLYPNPVAEKLYLSGVDENALISIADMTGRIIINKNLKGGYIQVSFLQEGVYTIMITDTKGTRSAKFVKKGK
jgi:hypothetical protein